MSHDPSLRAQNSNSETTQQHRFAHTLGAGEAMDVEPVPRYDDVLALIEHAFICYRDRPAYTCLGHTLTYADLDRLSARFACFLRHDLQLNAGDRLAIQLPNILQFPVVFYGAVRAGLVVVNVNPLYTARELKHQLVDSGARALVVLSHIAQTAAQVVADTALEKVVVTDIADLHPWPKKLVINAVVKHIKKMVPHYHFDNEKQVRFDDCFSSTSVAVDAPEYGAESLLMLQYTGGTTGVSKGAMLTHGNITANVWQAVTHLPMAFHDGDEVMVACLPLYHIYALNLHALAAFSRGGHNILIPNPRDLPALVKAIKHCGMTVFVGINTLFTALCRFPAFDHVDFSQLRVTSSGGMALTESAAKLWQQHTGCEVCEGYGLTETSPVLLGNQPGHIALGTIGVPLPETEIIIVDDDGNTLADGEPGELCARGPQVMAGYWQQPEETAKVMMADGFFKTGDIAVKNLNGTYSIVDRKKDMVIVSGFNVYPNEVEDVATMHPNIIEAAAIGVPDESCGEVVKLFAVCDDKNISAADVKKFCRKYLTPYKVPKVITFCDELPKTTVGKVLRRQLRDS